MTKCEKCKKDIPSSVANLQFCPHCGTKRKEHTTSAKSSFSGSSSNKAFKSTASSSSSSSSSSAAKNKDVLWSAGGKKVSLLSWKYLQFAKDIGIENRQL